MAISTSARVVAFIEAPGKSRWFSEHLNKHFPGVEVVATKGLLFNLPPIRPSSKIDVARLDTWVPIAGKPIDTVVNSARKATHIILACDDDPEGELISSHIAHFATSEAKIYRLKLGALTPSSLEAAVSELKPFRGRPFNAVSRRCFDYSLQTCFTESADGLPVSRVLSPALQLVSCADYKPSIISGTLDGMSVVPLPTDVHVFTARSFAVDDLELYGVTNTISINSNEPRFTTTRDLLVEGHVATNLEPDVIFRVAQGLYEQGVISYVRTSDSSGSAETIAGVASIASKLGLQAPVGVSTYPVPTGPHQAIMPLRYSSELYADGGEMGAVYRFILYRSISELYKVDYPSASILEEGAIRTLAGKQKVTFRRNTIDLGFGKGMQACCDNGFIPAGQFQLSQQKDLRFRTYSRVAQIIDLLHSYKICPPGQYVRQALFVTKFLSQGFELSGRGLFLQSRLQQLLPALLLPKTASDLQRIFSDETLDAMARLREALEYLDISSRVDLERAQSPVSSLEESEAIDISSPEALKRSLSYHPFSPGR